jgi:hypothetical protein
MKQITVDKYQEFLLNPSQISQELIRRVDIEQKKVGKFLKNDYDKFINRIKVHFWYLTKYQEFFSLLTKGDICKNNYKIKYLDKLLDEFSWFYNKIVWNNLQCFKRRI